MKLILYKLLNAIFRHMDIYKKNELYLRRYYLTPRKWRYRLFLHFINKPDDDRVEHDHPWWFVTAILSGGYYESILQNDKKTTKDVPHLAGTVLYRGSGHIHKILYVLPKTWTLVLAGPKKRTWGFWEEKKFIPWTEYLGVNATEAVDD